MGFPAEGGGRGGEPGHGPHGEDDEVTGPPQRVAGGVLEGACDGADQRWLGAVASLCMSAHNDGPGRAERMVALLVDGLRYGASHR